MSAHERQERLKLVLRVLCAADQDGVARLDIQDSRQHPPLMRSDDGHTGGCAYGRPDGLQGRHFINDQRIGEQTNGTRALF